MQLFNSILTSTTNNLTLLQVSLTLGTAILLGLLLATVYKYKNQYSKEFVILVSFLPTVITVIIFLVNGNLGTGVAVAGTFGFIRFRSAAGSARELLAVFMAMAIGLATGMGYIGMVILVTILYSIAMIVFENTSFAQADRHRRHLILTVAKDFNYDHIFEKNFGKSCRSAEMISLKYKKKKEVLVLEYQVDMDSKVSDKRLMDTLLETGPLDVIINKQVPKKKAL